MKIPNVMFGNGFVAPVLLTEKRKNQPVLKVTEAASLKSFGTHVRFVQPHVINIVTEKKKWMQSVKIKRPGICTGARKGSESCPQGSPQFALATTFSKSARKGGKSKK